MTLRDLDHLEPFDVTALRTPHGHTHFWDRAMSRRQAFGTAAAAAAALAGSTALRPLRAWAGDGGAEPRPIPGGLVAGGQGWHVNAPAYNTADDPGSGLPDQSTIFDFQGDIASAIVRGTGVGRQGGAVLPLVFDSDMRFMKGRYIGMDGRLRTGTFGFI